METIPIAEDPPIPIVDLVDSYDDEDAGDDDDGIMEYRCDVCLTAAFPTYEEALRHEQTCTGPAAPAAAPVHSDPVLVGPSSETRNEYRLVVPQSTQPKTQAENKDMMRDTATRISPKFATKSCLAFFSKPSEQQQQQHEHENGGTQPRNFVKPQLKISNKIDLTINEKVTTIKARPKKTSRKCATLPVSPSVPLKATTTSTPTSYATPLSSSPRIRISLDASSTTSGGGGFNPANQKKHKKRAAGLVNGSTATTGTPRKNNKKKNNNNNHVPSDSATPSQDTTAGLMMSATPKTTPDKQTRTKKRRTFVGQRVYAEFPANRQWYWGIITKETFTPVHNLLTPATHDPSSNTAARSPRQPITYQVWFDDDDVVDGIPGMKMVNEDEYLAKWQNTLSPPPKRPPHLNKFSLDDNGNIIVPTTSSPYHDDQNHDNDKIDNDADDDKKNDTDAGHAILIESQKNPEDLFLDRCAKCSMCLQPDCGRCASCVRATKNPSQLRGVCFRKMCLELPEDEKAQPAFGFPAGWRFYFSNVIRPQYRGIRPIGLALISPRQVVFRSVASAMNRYRKQFNCIPNLKRDFYAHIGEEYVEDGNNEQQVVEREDTPSPKKKRARSLSTTKRELSTPSPQKKRARSVKTKRELTTTKDIGSRVFCKFTNNSYYWGEIVDKREDKVGNVTFAVQFDDGDFLDHVADTSDDEPSGNIYTEYGFYQSSKKFPPKRPPSSLATVPKKIVSYTPAELYQKRCNNCRTCTQKECSRCDSCINNRDGLAESTECCLRNMCRRIHKDLKKQSAPGLPEGWTFASGIGPNVTLISPTGDEFDSFQDALDRCSVAIDNIDEAMFEFETFLGGSIPWNDYSHFLVGKEYCHEWTDVHSRNKVIYGMITLCNRDKLDESYALFTVKYNDDSFDDIVKARPSRDLDMELTTTMSLEWALGGYLSYVAKHESPHVLEEPLLSTTPCRRWLTPDMRTEELVVMGSNGKKLPRLTLVWNAFRLVFTVGPSNIQNAGLGVFVQCTSLVRARTNFRLRKGEMLDLGVYAPFRKEDLKEECVFLVKNFIMGLKCEEWAFDTGPAPVLHQYDITDDWTGELHDVAAQHIPAYVNECTMETPPSVHAEHDPEGVVHYLLGGRTSDLILPVDGSKVELFINYGPKYERVRIRKNYSFLPPAKQLAEAKSVDRENAEYLEEISGYQEREVTLCIEFVAKVVETGTLPDAFLLNALCVAAALRHRGRMLAKEIGDSTPFAVEFSEVMKRYEAVVKTLLQRGPNVTFLQLEAAGEHAILLSRLVNAVLKDLPPGFAQRVISLFSLK